MRLTPSDGRSAAPDAVRRLRLPLKARSGMCPPFRILPGDAFSGFLHKKQRSAYIEAGEKAPWVKIGG
jgi:hypothetical protein